MKKILQISISVYFILFFVAMDTIAAPLIPLGPADIIGTISEIQWMKETKVKGIHGMSGSAGRNRLMPAHFLLKLTNYEGVDSQTAIRMTSYLDWSALKDHGKIERPPFVLLRINHDDEAFLKEGMRIKVIGYTVKGDEGGTWTSYKHLEILDVESLRIDIKDYLQNHIESPGSGGKMFCSYELFGSERKGDRKYLYLWALCMEYYLKEGVIMQGAGFSMPLALISMYSADGYKLIEHQKPVDGEGYGESIREIFPPNYHKTIFAEGGEYNRRGETLLKDTERQALQYYVH